MKGENGQRTTARQMAVNLFIIIYICIWCTVEFLIVLKLLHLTNEQEKDEEITLE